MSRDKLDGVELRDGKLRIAPVSAMTPQEADTIAGRLDGLLPAAQITEVLHEVARETGFAAAFTNLPIGEPCSNDNALFAAILADATNLGLSRMSDASQGVTRDQLVWTANAFIREETYRAALARSLTLTTSCRSLRFGATAPPHRRTGSSFAGRAADVCRLRKRIQVPQGLLF